ncbi:MAG: head-tail adaptor protein [Bacteroidota bacterium]
MDKIGQLRYRIKFAVPLRGRDSVYGGGKDTWIFSEELFAHREYTQVGSNEQESAGQMSPVTRVVFTIRGRDGIDASMQIIYEEKIHRINSVLPTQRRDYIQLETEQIGDWQDQALVQADGQSLIDSDGQAIVWQPSADQSEGYEAPGLVFRDSEGQLYERV